MKLSFPLNHFLTVLFIFSTSLALAGEKLSYKVTIAPEQGTAGWAWGAVGSARNSPDKNQFIGCSCSGGPPANAVQCSCVAQNSSGKRLSCFTYDPDLMAVARMANSNSYIQFHAENGSKCTYLAVDNSSRYEIAR